MIQRLGEFFTGSTGFERKLGRYALAGTAMLGLPAIAHADIIYYSGVLNENVTDGNTLTVNLPVVGPTASFTISARSLNLNPFSSFIAQAISVSGTDTSFVDDTSGLPVDLNLGDTISAANATGLGGDLSAVSFSKLGFGADGNWPTDGTPGLLGLSFTSGGDQFNGWARIIANSGDVFAAAESATLVDFAYNETAGDSIDAGQLSGGPISTPEPSGLAFFALGAAGVVALRKRRASR
jgi:hypothetical protein